MERAPNAVASAGTAAVAPPKFQIELKVLGEGGAAVLAQSWWTRIAHLADGIQPDTVEDAELKRLLERNRQQ